MIIQQQQHKSRFVLMKFNVLLLKWKKNKLVFSSFVTIIWKTVFLQEEKLCSLFICFMQYVLRSFTNLPVVPLFSRILSGCSRCKTKTFWRHKIYTQSSSYIQDFFFPSYFLVWCLTTKLFFLCNV